MDETTPLRQSGELSIPPPSNETGNNTHNNSLNEAQAPSSSSSNKYTPSSIPNLMNILPREIRDYIYELTFAENNLVVFGRRGILPEAHEGPKHPETTSQMISKYDQVIYPGTHSSFGTQDADNTSKNATQTAGNDDDQIIAPQQAELSAYGASVRKSLRWYDPASIRDTANDEAVVKFKKFVKFQKFVKFKKFLDSIISRPAVAGNPASNRATTLLRPSAMTTEPTTRPTRRLSLSGPPPARPT
jgi:hypothetical protein